MPKGEDFEKFNHPSIYDFIRSSVVGFRDYNGNLCRSVKFEPNDPTDQNEERARLIVSGVHRIGFDSRTHHVSINENKEIVIEPIT